MTNGLYKLIKGLMPYSIATIGPIISAAVQFALSLLVLRVVDASAFGAFSFLFVAAQFSWGIWSAMFCALLPTMLAKEVESARADLLRCLFAANLFGAVCALVLFLPLALALGAGALASVFFSVYASAALLRWFARAYAYAIGAPLRAATSDLVYSATLLAGLVLIAIWQSLALELAFLCLFISTIIGLLPFGRSYLVAQFGHFSFNDLRRYRRVWQSHSRWSLLGVLTTEATANSHAYGVTFIAGPTAFAPIAASGLMIRPVSVAMNAMTEFERARMARLLHDKRLDLVNRSMHIFRALLALIWLMTGLATVLLFAYAPRLVFPETYDLSYLMIGALLWMGVAGIRLLRTPDSVLLQAAGAFRPLAYASVVSSGVSMLAVVTLLLIAAPLWSIAGVLIGEIVFALWIWLQVKAWRRGYAEEMASANADRSQQDHADAPDHRRSRGAGGGF